MVTETKARPCDRCGLDDCKCVILMDGAQSDFFHSKAFSPALIAGRGYGKTIAFSAKAFRYAQDNPGGRGVLTQPTFDMIRRNFMPVWENQWGHLKGIWEYRIVLQGTPQEIAFHNGFVYDLRPATNEMAERFRGATYCVAGMDELRNEDQLACYLALIAAVRAPGFPLQFFVTSTPEARRPWIKKIWTEKTDPISGEPLPPEDYPKFRASMEDNWYLTEVQKKRIRAMYGGRSRYAQQELDALDVALEGIAFEDFGEVHIQDPPVGHEFVRTLNGLDCGATSPTAMHEGKLDRAGTLWITREFYMRNADDYDWIRAAADWGSQEIVCDPSRSEKEIQELRRKYGVNLKRARSPAKRFEDRVRMTRNRLSIRETGKPRMYVSPSCPNLISEYRNLAFAQPRIGEWAVDRWETGLNDHAYDDVNYLLSHVDLPPPSYGFHPKYEKRGWNY